MEGFACGLSARLVVAITTDRTAGRLPGTFMGGVRFANPSLCHTERSKDLFE